MWSTRYIGIISYGLVSALLIAKDIVKDVEGAVILLAPIAAFVVADQIKHRDD
jgi:hypothetical protein|tara:strand:- start:129 stop:287 length:159 start_codon:yes stop_codon:yes gene_type:complete